MHGFRHILPRVDIMLMLNIEREREKKNKLEYRISARYIKDILLNLIDSWQFLKRQRNVSIFSSINGEIYLTADNLVLLIIIIISALRLC